MSFFEIINLISAIACWVCGTAFAFFLVFVWRIWNTTIKIAWILITNCAISIGLTFFENALGNYTYKLAIHLYVLLSSISLAILFAYSIYYIIRRYKVDESFILSEYMNNALVAIGLATAIGKDVKKKDLYRQFSKNTPSLIRYSVLKNQKLGLKSFLSEDKKIWTFRARNWIGLLYKTIMLESSTFLMHEHDCWEIVEVKQGVIFSKYYQRYFYEGDAFLIPPFHSHNPYTSPGAMLNVYFINKKWKLKLFQIFGPRYLLP